MICSQMMQTNIGIWITTGLEIIQIQISMEMETLNSIDAAPFDPNDIYDTDGDGVSDSYDPNDDGDNFLDIDDPDL